MAQTPKPKATSKKRAPAKKPVQAAPPALQPLAGTRQESESDKAVLACNDYLRLPNRSLRKLRKRYLAKPDETRQNPTVSFHTLADWSAQFGWFGRAVRYDMQYEQEENDIHKASLRTGMATTYERLRMLKEMASVLDDELFEEDETGRMHNFWLAEPKVMLTPDGAEIVDIYRYNAPLVSHLFQVLDDIAKETNGRRVGDRAEELLQAMIMKVGADKLPLNLVNRIAAGEGAYEVFIDAINALDVSSLPTYHNTANGNGGGG